MTRFDPGLLLPGTRKSPFAKARAVFEKLGGVNLEELLMRYLEQGCYVVANPGAFLLAAPVQWAGGRMIHSDQAPDTWFIHLAAVADGALNPVRFLMEQAPHPLPWVAWQRRGRPLRRYKWDNLTRVAGR